MPVLRVARQHDQILKALGIKSVVHLELAQRGLDAAVDVRVRRGDAGAFAGAGDLRDDQRAENADDDDHQHQFREGEARHARGLIFCVVDFHG